MTSRFHLSSQQRLLRQFNAPKSTSWWLRGFVAGIFYQSASTLYWTETPAANWRRHSFAGYLEPIEYIEDTHLDDLVGIEQQKQVLEKNTRQFLRGYPANNVLLWGSRVTG